MHPHTQQRDSVLLIPDTEEEPPPFGIAPGYYNRRELLELVQMHANCPDAIQFIADMLESGVQEFDGFARQLRDNRNDASCLSKIVRMAQA